MEASIYSYTGGTWSHLGQGIFYGSFDKMVRRSAGHTVYNMDGSAFEASISPQLQQAIFNIIGGRLDLTPTDRVVWDNLVSTLVKGLIVTCDGYPLMKYGMNASGNGLTSIFNTITSIFYLMYGIIDQFPNLGYFDIISQFGAFAYGDDIVLWHNKDSLDIMRFKSVIAHCFGLVYESASPCLMQDTLWFNMSFKKVMIFDSYYWVPVNNGSKAFFSVQKPRDNYEKEMNRASSIRLYSYFNDKWFKYFDAFARAICTPNLLHDNMTILELYTGLDFGEPAILVHPLMLLKPRKYQLFDSDALNPKSIRFDAPQGSVPCGIVLQSSKTADQIPEDIWNYGGRQQLIGLYLDYDEFIHNHSYEPQNIFSDIFATGISKLAWGLGTLFGSQSSENSRKLMPKKINKANRTARSTIAKRIANNSKPKQKQQHKAEEKKAKSKPILTTGPQRPHSAPTKSISPKKQRATKSVTQASHPAMARARNVVTKLRSSGVPVAYNQGSHRAFTNVRSNGDTMYVHGKDRLSLITIGDNKEGSILFQQDINPTLIAGQRVQRFASCFDQYSIPFCAVHFEHSAATSADGNLQMWFEMDPTDVAPEGRQGLDVGATHPSCVNGSLYQNLTCIMEKPMNGRYYMEGDSNSDSDRRLTQQGRLEVRLQVPSNVLDENSTIGVLWIEYFIKMSRPTIQPLLSATSNFDFQHLNGLVWNLLINPSTAESMELDGIPSQSRSNNAGVIMSKNNYDIDGFWSLWGTYNTTSWPFVIPAGVWSVDLQYTVIPTIDVTHMNADSDSFQILPLDVLVSHDEGVTWSSLAGFANSTANDSSQVMYAESKASGQSYPASITGSVFGPGVATPVYIVNQLSTAVPVTRYANFRFTIGNSDVKDGLSTGLVKFVLSTGAHLSGLTNSFSFPRVQISFNRTLPFDSELSSLDDSLALPQVQKRLLALEAIFKKHSDTLPESKSEAPARRELAPAVGLVGVQHPKKTKSYP
jgi:hypothetical protein